MDKEEFTKMICGFLKRVIEDTGLSDSEINQFTGLDRRVSWSIRSGSYNSDMGLYNFSKLLSNLELEEAQQNDLIRILTSQKVESKRKGPKGKEPKRKEPKRKEPKRKEPKRKEPKRKARGEPLDIPFLDLTLWKKA